MGYKEILKHLHMVNKYYIGLIIVLGMISYINPTNVIINIFLLAICMGVLDGCYFFIVGKKLRLHIYAIPPVQKYQELVLEVEIRNTSAIPFLYFYILPKNGERIKLTEKNNMALMIGRKQTVSYQMKYQAKYSGQDFIGVEWGIMKSFLGIFKKEIHLESYVRVRVLPEIRYLEEGDNLVEQFMAMQMMGCEEQLKGQGLNGAEIGYELRPYREGDSQKLIHWKLAAVKNQYLVRQREEGKVQKEDLCLMLLPFEEYLPRQEKIQLQDKTVTTTIALAMHFLRQGQVVRIVYYMDKDWKEQTLSQMSEINKLQDLLSYYESISVHGDMNEIELMKDLTYIMNRYKGMRLIVSAFWQSEIEKWLISKGNRINPPTFILTKEGVNQALMHTSYLKLWHMTQQYRLERIN